MSDITLSKAVRSNLLSLQNTADMMATTQNRLATGKKVNSALDNPTNFFTASSLNSRASDINALMDGMANGIQTIEAADNGLTAITKTLESMQSTLRQARQDKSFETGSYALDATAIGTTDAKSLTFSGGAIGETGVTVELNPEGPTEAVPTTLTGAAGTTAFTATDTDATGASFNLAGGTGNVDIAVTNGSTKQQIADAINAQTAATGVSATVGTDGSLALTEASGADITITAVGDDAGTADNDEAADSAELITHAFGTTTTSSNGEAAGTARAVSSVDDLVRTINNNSQLEGKIRASNDNGQLRIENLSTQELNVDGVSSTGEIDGESSDQTTIGGNSVRADLANQYNELRDQLDKLADDASFNGINLLRGDKLTITFNETDTSSLEIQSRIPNEDGEATSGLSINSASLGIKTNMEESDLDSDTSIDSMLADIKTAVNTVRSQASAFGSSLSIVENRQDFSKNMINTLETGASNLTLADANEEAANLLALQTRQQLSSTALSMASQQDQAVLRLF
ncbi:flagellin [Pelagibacterium sp. H642]|uniref:flagellin N-terminal helical domain-containing protein n=1 Tax=Pelagibacterium sp. H642 TaxID=1881069 RepID=UPI002814BF58|nr:flagellin [Pelagibacterium sp. H642]WMT89986.1 flagellin [Pelagibacterium sp. H642]